MPHLVVRIRLKFLWISFETMEHFGEWQQPNHTDSDRRSIRMAYMCIWKMHWKIACKFSFYEWIIICDQFMIARCEIARMWKMITFKAWPYKHTWIRAIIRVENLWCESEWANGWDGLYQRANDPVGIAPQGKKVWNCIELWMKSTFFTLFVAHWMCVCTFAFHGWTRAWIRAIDTTWQKQIENKKSA